MDDKLFKLYTDGACRGNPGHGGVGAVLIDETGCEVFAVHKYLGMCTNNIAEYMALICGLEKAVETGCRRLEIFMDSELLVKQINNEYRVKNANLIDLMKKVRKLLAAFEAYRVCHIRREHNKTADLLANKAIDEAMKKGSGLHS
ncbi:MAG: ribonuclease HI family protein [Deltaproteobacteria bacterium]|nr:ribonuclease HI family protein [Deltaproteobacteria bacterium]